MNFVSATFFVFVIAVFLSWWLLPSKVAKFVLITANLIFYAYWYPPYLVILVFIGAVNFWTTRRGSLFQNQKRVWLFTAIGSSLAILAYFKYANFLIGSVFGLFALLSPQAASPFIKIILPMGISFYTFQAISYSIDVYKGKTEAVENFIDFFLYLSFFPQLVAGPIVRALDFIPQIKQRTFPGFEDWEFALHRITRGFFLKVIIADNIARSVNLIFSGNIQNYSSIDAWLGAIFFGVQIFCDFAGYSDIAIGISRLFGFRLLENFDNPYLSTTMSDFWRRWHISMSSWFRDYVYFPLARSTWMNETFYKPLANSRLAYLRTSLNTFFTFFLSGLWHGASWNFVLWGVLHGLGIVIEQRTNIAQHQNNPALKSRIIKSSFAILTILYVFFLWVPFRLTGFVDIISYWQAMFLGGINLSLSTSIIVGGSFWLGLFLVYQLIMAYKENRISTDGLWPMQRVESWVYFALLLIIPSSPTDFIYFQF